MTTEKPPSGENISDSLKRVLESHGYGFQYAVLRRADTLFAERRSKWEFEVAEFPVEVRGNPTRIDFILRRPPALYLVAECKRVNPALSNWCFVRAPYTRRNPRYREVVAEEVIDGGNQVQTRPVRLSGTRTLYHHAFEIASESEGDAPGGEPGAIEQATIQVCRGVNGLIETFPTQIAEMASKEKIAHFLPVIFTTATIWTSEIDLASADLERGALETGSTAVTERPWIWYQYNVAPGLRHSRPAKGAPTGLGPLLDMEYARTIAVVGSAGIEEFLTREFV